MIQRIHGRPRSASRCSKSPERTYLRTKEGSRHTNPHVVSNLDAVAGTQARSMCRDHSSSQDESLSASQWRHWPGCITGGSGRAASYCGLQAWKVNRVAALQVLPSQLHVRRRRFTVLLVKPGVRMRGSGSKPPDSLGFIHTKLTLRSP